MNSTYKLGFGIDFHQLVEGRELFLGGVAIPHTKGALGHSDADVLLHAICDAMLGALALGDIGIHFPNTDPAYKDIDSKKLLAKCVELIGEKGYRVINVDSSLTLEKPKIKPYVTAMQETIAGILGIGTGAVSIKATTTETMGFVGREEGLVAYATVLLDEITKAKLPVKIKNESAFDLPAYATTGSAGMDLRANITDPISLQPLERTLVPTGLYMELPNGFEAQIRPRSGLAIKQGITCLNTPGTIDADYRGEIKVILINLSNEIQLIAPGDRIAQMVIQSVQQVSWVPVEILSSTERNAGGFGHTGKA
nr:2-C-methyl-D-erythritol 2,4-cyclodiphosphate synthase [Flavihumibacter sp. UBA7668]